MSRIIKAGLEDIKTITAIDQRVIGSSARNKHIEKAVKNGELYLAKVNGETAGYAIFNYSFYENGFIELLIVAEAYRRRGMGELLIKQIISDCRTEKLFTSTNLSNIPMQSLCEKCGFIKSGYIENLDEGDPEIIFFYNCHRIM